MKSFAKDHLEVLENESEYHRNLNKIGNNKIHNYIKIKFHDQT